MYWVRPDLSTVSCKQYLRPTAEDMKTLYKGMLTQYSTELTGSYSNPTQDLNNTRQKLKVPL